MKESSNGKTSGHKTATTKKSADHPKNGLREMFDDQLKDIYWAEKALTKAIPKMIEKATSEELIDALTEHLEVTEQQVARCEEIFSTLDMKPAAKKCEAMEGLLKEGTEIMESAQEGSALDAGIICAAQKVEHYEIATYGTLVAWAKQLGEDEAAALLEETLNEEKEADSVLTEVAESCINAEATTEEEDEE